MADKKKNPYATPSVATQPNSRPQIDTPTKYSVITRLAVVLTIYLFAVSVFAIFVGDGGFMNGQWTRSHWRDALAGLGAATLSLIVSICLIRRDQKLNQYP